MSFKILRGNAAAVVREPQLNVLLISYNATDNNLVNLLVIGCLYSSVRFRLY
ncbi:MAG: hypothetical protein H8D56_00045 [Planctomycetes bacterium]|nr:hypothetical protein [Planctomycetota bacterium]